MHGPLNVKFYNIKWSQKCILGPFAIFHARSHPFPCPNRQNGRTSGNFGNRKKFAFINVKFYDIKWSRNCILGPFSMRVRTHSRVQIDKTALRPHERKFRKTKKICFYKCKILRYKVVSELHFGAICHFQCAFAPVRVSKSTKRPQTHIENGKWPQNAIPRPLYIIKFYIYKSKFSWFSEIPARAAILSIWTPERVRTSIKNGK